MDQHYPKAIEQTYICIDNVVQQRSKQAGTGKNLMFAAFQEQKATGKPVLRINDYRSITDKSEQEGFAHVTAGCMMLCRNPRAHNHDIKDEPLEALRMIVWGDQLLRRIRAATRTRVRKSP